MVGGMPIVILYCCVKGGPVHPESAASTVNTNVPVDVGVPLKLYELPLGVAMMPGGSAPAVILQVVVPIWLSSITVLPLYGWFRPPPCSGTGGPGGGAGERLGILCGYAVPDSTISVTTIQKSRSSLRSNFISRCSVPLQQARTLRGFLLRSPPAPTSAGWR